MNHIKQITPALSEIKTGTPGFKIGSQFFVGGIGGNFIPGMTGTDVSDTTAIASDVLSGKYFYTASGVKTAGTGSGATSFYKCASVGSGTWTGYKAVQDSTTKVWSFEQSLTTDTLTFDSSKNTPVVGGCYNSNSLIRAILWEGMPTDCLVFHAPLKSNEPNTKLGNPLGYNGTINISSDGALFTDRNSYIQSMIGFSNCSECTIACWIYMSNDAGESSADYPRFMCLGTDISKQYDYANDWFTLTFSKDIGKIKVQVPDCGNWPGEGITFPRNQFFHFAGVISGNTIIPYLNGTAQTSATMRNTFMLPNYATLYINQVRANYGIDGVRIADVRVYNKALSSAEINALASVTPTA